MESTHTYIWTKSRANQNPWFGSHDPLTNANIMACEWLDHYEIRTFFPDQFWLSWQIETLSDRVVCCDVQLDIDGTFFVSKNLRLTQISSQVRNTIFFYSHSKPSPWINQWRTVPGLFHWNKNHIIAQITEYIRVIKLNYSDNGIIQWIPPIVV